MAENTTHNPYAAPRVEEPTAVARGLWTVEGSELWVRSGAHFPDVDLVTGEINPDGARLRRRHLHVASPGVLVLVFVMAGVVFGAGWLRDRYQLPINGYWGLPVLWLASTVIGRKFPKAFGTRAGVVFTYMEGRRRGRRQRWVLAGIAACIAGMFVAVATTDFVSKHMLKTLLISLGVLLVLTLVMVGVLLVMNGRPGAAGFTGDWLRLTGVSPEAIEHLRRQPRPETVTADPNLRQYVIHLRKIPFSDWWRAVGWKPRVLFNVALAKAFRISTFITHAMIRLKPAKIDPATISDEFREKVAALEPELLAAGWTFKGWDRAIYPDRAQTRVETASFIQEDRRAVLVVMESVSGSVRPGLATILHSWLEDGRTMRTSNGRDFNLKNPAVDAENHRGMGHSAVAARHLERLASRQAVVLGDDAEMGERFIRMALENHAWFHKQGIYGQLEEIPA